MSKSHIQIAIPVAPELKAWVQERARCGERSSAAWVRLVLSKLKANPALLRRVEKARISEPSSETGQLADSAA